MAKIMAGEMHSDTAKPSTRRMSPCWRWTALVLMVGTVGGLVGLATRLFAPATMPSPMVILRQGSFLGISGSGSAPPLVLEQFLGIPYAQPPTGDLRFRPPLRVNASNHNFDATQWGLRCPSGRGNDTANPEGEDCLNLNVFRPAIRPSNKKLPVLVYIYGGSFNFGFAKATAISSLVSWSPEPMIGITFNYRIGALGFLPGNVTANEGILNLGLKDQNLLLEWVQENVEAFGGDPDNVTVMGQSAGAHSVGHQLMANTDKPPLFNRVIMESGAPTARIIYPYYNPLHLQQFNEFVQAVGCSNVSEDDLMATLRTLPVLTIAGASEGVYGKYSSSLAWAFQPVIEGPGGFISEAPINDWRSGNWHKVPILTGFNTDEGASFVPSNMSNSTQFRNFFHTLLPGLSSSDLDQIDKLYPDPSIQSSPYQGTQPGQGAEFKRVAAAYGQFAYISPVRQTAQMASSSSSGNSSTATPVYLYQFAVNGSATKGAGHGDELGYVTYSQSTVDISAAQKQIAGYMHAYWTSFILTGDPNAVKGSWPDRPLWPAYDGVTDGVGQKIEFGQGNNERAGGTNVGITANVTDDSWARTECEFWWSKTDISER